MESDRFVCVKDVSDEGTTQVVIIDTHNNNTITRKPMKADSTLMNPVKNTMALKGLNEGLNSHYIQVFDLDTKSKLGSHSFNGAIVFWKWLNETELAIICAMDVYHWVVATEEPKKIFQRCGKLAESTSQIISYSTTEDKNWCVVCSIYMKEEGVIEGAMQLYSVEKNQQQLLIGHAGCFALTRVTDKPELYSIFAFIERKESSHGTVEGVNSKLHIMDLSRSSGYKIGMPIKMPCNNTPDFAIFMTLTSMGLLVAVTKGGYALGFDVVVGTTIFCEKISEEGIFVACALGTNDGIKCVNRKGEIVTLRINGGDLLSSILRCDTEQSQKIAIALVKRFQVPMEESQFNQLFRKQFHSLFNSGNFKAAADVVAGDTSLSLRTAEILQMFRSAAAVPGGGSPLLQYFSALLEIRGLRLNKTETLLLITHVVQQGRRDLLDKWILEDRLHCCEETADVVERLDNSNDNISCESLAVRVYENIARDCGNCSIAVHDKVIAHKLKERKFTEISAYIKTTNCGGYQWPNLARILGSVIDLDKGAGLTLAKFMVAESLATIDFTVNTLMTLNKMDVAAALLLDTLRGLPDDHSAEDLQTRLLEITLMYDTNKGEAMIRSGRFTHFNRTKLAQACESIGMWELAIEHFVDFKKSSIALADVRRCISISEKLTSPFVEDFISRLLNNRYAGQNWIRDRMYEDITTDSCILILTELMNKHASIKKLVVQICIKYHGERADVTNIANAHITLLLDMINLFDTDHHSTFLFLGGVLPSLNGASLLPTTHKYINAALLCGHEDEVERIVRMRTGYDPLIVQQLLLEHYRCLHETGEGVNPKPLIHLCDIHGFTDVLVGFLHGKGLMNYLHVYISKVNPKKTPEVIGRLIDLNVEKEEISKLLPSTAEVLPFSLSELVDVVFKKGKLVTLKPFLDELILKGSKNEAVHNAMGMICVLTGTGKEFLTNNTFYNQKELGKFCESRDSLLACLAYEKGNCDDDLIRICIQSCLFKNMARYLIARKDLHLWKRCLSEDNKQESNTVSSSYNFTSVARDAIFEELLNVALPESSCNDSVICAVKAFAAAGVPDKLILLLQKVIFAAPYKDNRLSEKTYHDLENLLLLTAIKSTPERVMDYIEKLTHYDSNQIARIALAASLREEAFQIYKKAGMAPEAMETLLTSFGESTSIEAGQWIRAREFAISVDHPKAWSLLGNALLIASQGAEDDSYTMASEAIGCYIKGKDVSEFGDVIEVGLREECFRELITYLELARRLGEETCSISQKSPSLNASLPRDKCISINLQLVDTELTYCLAKVNREKRNNATDSQIEYPDDFTDLSTFLSLSHRANLKQVGDRLYEEKLFSVAVIIYKEAKLYSLMCPCYLHLGLYVNALECAQFANDLQTWKEVCFAALTAGELEIAQTAGIPIINSVELFVSVLNRYKEDKEYMALIQLLERSIEGDEESGSGAHQGVYTELGVLYSTQCPDKLSDFIAKYGARVSVPKLVKACEDLCQWNEAVALYGLYDEPEKAIRLMIEHQEEAFSYHAFAKAVLGCLTSHRRMPQELLQSCIDSFLVNRSHDLDLLFCDVFNRYIELHGGKISETNIVEGSVNDSPRDRKIQTIESEFATSIIESTLGPSQVLNTLMFENVYRYLQQRVELSSGFIRHYLYRLQITLHELIISPIRGGTNKFPEYFKLIQLVSEINDIRNELTISDFKTENVCDSGDITESNLKLLVGSIANSIRMSYVYCGSEVPSIHSSTDGNINQEEQIMRVSESIFANVVFTELIPILSTTQKEYSTENIVHAFKARELAELLKSSDLVELRAVAIVIFAYLKEYQYSIELCLSEMMFEEAIVIARISGNYECVHHILNYFLSEAQNDTENRNDNLTWFARTLTVCENLVKPHVVVSLAWKYKCLDSAMPFLIGTIEKLHKRIDNLELIIKKSDDLKSGSGSPDQRSSIALAPAKNIVPAIVDIKSQSFHSKSDSDKSRGISQNSTQTSKTATPMLDTGYDWESPGFDLSALGEL